MPNEAVSGTEMMVCLTGLKLRVPGFDSALRCRPPGNAVSSR
jgi:hypothetical protein